MFADDLVLLLTPEIQSFNMLSTDAKFKTFMSCPNYNVIFSLAKLMHVAEWIIYSLFLFFVVVTVCMTNGPSGLYSH